MLLAKRRTARFVALFALVFAALNLPAPDFGRAVVAIASDLGNAIGGSAPALRGDASMIGGATLEPHLELRFEPTALGPTSAALSIEHAWSITLHARRVDSRAHTDVRIDLRKAFWIPVAVFLALVLASPIWRGTRGWVVLVAGLCALQIPIALLTTIHASGLLYEHYVIDLSDGARAAARFGYALLAPPGVVYATPLLLWAALMFATRPRVQRAEHEQQRDQQAITHGCGADRCREQLAPPP